MRRMMLSLLGGDRQRGLSTILHGRECDGIEFTAELTLVGIGSSGMCQ